MAGSRFSAVVGRISSIVGSALNFGGRRFGTIARVAWLPVVLLLILDMAGVFIYLSIAAGRLISFADVASYVEARGALGQLWGLAWMSHFETMAIVFGALTGIQLILISTFMAPLIRLAGLGETPERDGLRAEFGPDQFRFFVSYLLSFLILPLLLLAPISATAYYVLKYVAEAMQQVYLSFPDPQSLHTVEFVTGSDLIERQGRLWYFLSGIPLAAAAPFALLFWIALTTHFRPEPGERSVGWLARALGALIGGGGVVALIWFGFLDVTKQAANGPAGIYLGIAALVVAMLLYLGVRLLPYAGVAVCRRSLAFAGTFKVTRGWRLIWLIFVVVLIYVLINVVLVGANFAFVWMQSVFEMIYAAADSASRLAHEGEAEKWIYPFFVMTWNLIKILVNVAWAFFSYGVFAGLLGRLYRESEGRA